MFGAILVGGWFGGIAGLVIGIGFDIGHLSLWGSSSLSLMIIGAIAGAIISGLNEGSNRAKAARIQKEQIEEQRRRKAKEHQDMLRNLFARIREVSRSAVDAFEVLPKDLSNALDWHAEAMQHYALNAYSPFWHAIEQAYDNLGFFNWRIGFIRDRAQEYSNFSRKYREDGGKNPVPPFPVELDEAAATAAANAVQDVLHRTVYEAQRNAVFAQIWEQRRTTAAVVRGFATLESAVVQMAGALEASITELTVGIFGTRDAVLAAAAQADRNSQSSLQVEREISDKLGRAVYYLRQEEKRALNLG